MIKNTEIGSSQEWLDEISKELDDIQIQLAQLQAIILPSNEGKKKKKSEFKEEKKKNDEEKNINKEEKKEEKKYKYYKDGRREDEDVDEDKNSKPKTYEERLKEFQRNYWRRKKNEPQYA